MVGGVLVERTVKDVLPALEYNYQQVDSESTCTPCYVPFETLPGFHGEWLRGRVRVCDWGNCTQNRKCYIESLPSMLEDYVKLLL